MTTFWQKDCRIAVYDIRGEEDDDLLSSEQPFSGKFDIHSKINKKEATVVVSYKKLFCCRLLFIYTLIFVNSWISLRCYMINTECPALVLLY